MLASMCIDLTQMMSYTVIYVQSSRILSTIPLYKWQKDGVYCDCRKVSKYIIVHCL